MGNEVEEVARQACEITQKESWRPLDIGVFECTVYCVQLGVSDSKFIHFLIWKYLFFFPVLNKKKYTRQL